MKIGFSGIVVPADMVNMASITNIQYLVEENNNTAIGKDGNLQICGYDEEDQLSLNDTQDRLNLTKVSTHNRYKHVSYSSDHTTMINPRETNK